MLPTFLSEAETTVNIPTLSGNRLQLLDAAEPILRSIIRDSVFLILAFIIVWNRKLGREITELGLS